VFASHCPCNYFIDYNTSQNNSDLFKSSYNILLTTLILREKQQEAKEECDYSLFQVVEEEQF